ncbi:GNAT family N-acetyltransferase [Catenulispora sp. NF23]|uniref:GNAT family N-acetyltransferase n=1 Tax=Catenulispora pinistramenti TaxID=2705254 RepID=UPI001BA8991D|nr:GNAT family protein [Catenulispora pinistramenti]MBS2536633.1 GNAT family N-acetyltransferase [Catenulispora pinistramenti]
MPSPLHEYPRGPRLSLREFRPDDLLAWQRIGGDPRVAAHTPWPALSTPDTAGAWLSESARMAQLQPRRSFYLAIEQYDTLIGSATLDILSFPHRQGEIGVYLRPDRWAEGLGTETARLLLELAFSRLELHRVQTTVDPRNTPGMRVAEHVKMRPEGVLLDRFLVGGQWQDRAMYAITMPEWRGGRGGAHAAAGTQPAAAEAGAGGAGDAGGGAETGGADGAGGMSFEGGPEEPLLGVPMPPPQAEEPLVGETVSEAEARYAETPESDKATEVNEPQMLTAQIVREQIEVVHILPREP